jgi:hypothetical protein
MSQTAWLRPLVDPEAERLRIGLAEISAELRAGTLRPSAHDASHQFPDALRTVLATIPQAAWPRLSTAINEDQIESKLWLVEHLAQVMDFTGSRVVILGAWYGVLALIMNRLLPAPPAEVQCIDIDAATCSIATRVLSIVSPRPEVVRADMMDLDYAALNAERPTVFINTSSEHLPDFPRWRSRIPTGTRLVLQNNNHLGCSEHVNCVSDVAELEQQAHLSHIDYRGTLPLKHFQRFMLIGRT